MPATVRKQLIRLHGYLYTITAERLKSFRIMEGKTCQCVCLIQHERARHHGAAILNIGDDKPFNKRLKYPHLVRFVIEAGRYFKKLVYRQVKRYIRNRKDVHIP